MFFLICWLKLDGPATLEAIIILSLFPVFFNHDPIIFSVSP
tara:strand:- start:36 stop:158 length:123 start_codon:yes stop_codon:yes gene_type:complete